MLIRVGNIAFNDMYKLQFIGHLGRGLVARGKLNILNTS